MTHLIVAGAGIGGLATALALARSGTEVTVLERRDTLAEFGAGIQLAPNATRILARFGLLDRLRAVATEPEIVRIRRGRDGADLARLPLGRAAAIRYGAPFLLLHRPELQRILAEAAATAGVDIVFAAAVDDVAPVAGRGVQVVAAGRERRADGFVDARGWRGPSGSGKRRTAWRALLAVPDDRDRQPRSNLWLGPDTHLVHYPIGGGTRVNVVAITEERHPAPIGDDDPWSRPGDPAELRRAFAGWHAEALRWLDPTADWGRWPLVDAPAAAPWSAGPLTQVGDAAHPMLPFLAQGASQAIEDAGALADAVHTRTDVAAAFGAYEAARRSRAARVQAASRRQGDVYHLGRPAADARDIVMRLLGGPGSLARFDWLYGRAARASA